MAGTLELYTLSCQALTIGHLRFWKADSYMESSLSTLQASHDCIRHLVPPHDGHQLDWENA